MKRRDVLKAIAGCAMVGGVSITAKAASSKHGLLTVESHRCHKALTGEDLHVFCDGVDVTRHCYEADDTQGYALVFCHDEQPHRDWTKVGHVHVGGDGGPCRLRLTGHVVMCPVEKGRM